MSEYKGYNIKSDGTFGMKQIVTVGPGSVPNTLKGSFTNAGAAQRAIEVHLVNTPEKKVKKHDEANSSGRG